MTITVQMKHNVRAWVDDALEQLGYPDLQILIGWNSRFTSRMGDASCPYLIGGIRLSIPLWPRASESERREVVLHEVCHVVVIYENKKTGKKVRSHGREWQHKMRQLGLEPKRCHQVSTEGLKRTRKTVQMYCACKIQMETPRVAKRISRGSHWYRCVKCKAKLKFEPYDSTPKPEPVKPPHSQSPPPKSKSDSTRLSEWLREASKK